MLVGALFVVKKKGSKRMKAKYLNQDIRKAINEKGLAHYEVANALGIAPTTFSSWLLTELAPERKERVLEAIRTYTGQRAIYLNQDIREAIRKAGLANYEVANEMGITPITFSHWLQRELTQEQTQRVYAAIASIKA